MDCGSLVTVEGGGRMWVHVERRNGRYGRDEGE